ncbi:hypothetical protein EV216_10723 [Rhodovulum steppense]|uniref:Uncharacterized protein n=1 Tax=Rhodovulum steppense TaxID=540251 RepID=A0A4R1YWA8_9RHOB|nr:hypothetical protein EV216_10723 [Rhodovulum steppense]
MNVDSSSQNGRGCGIKQKGSGVRHLPACCASCRGNHFGDILFIKSRTHFWNLLLFNAQKLLLSCQTTQTLLIMQYRISLPHDSSVTFNARVRSWYRELGPHDDWWDAVYEDLERVCEILGIRLKTTPVRLMGGRTRAKPCIWFSGFWNQGDGACFEGYWSHAKGAAARGRDCAPMDAMLHGIADRLQALQRRNFYQLAE